MNRGTALFDQAEAAVAGEPVLRERVRLARLPLDNQWLRGYRLYKAQAGTGGMYDEDSKKNLVGLSVRLDDQGQPQTVAPNVPTQQTVTPGKGAGDGEYHLYDLGTHELHGGICVWFGTTGGVSPENVKAIWIDRVLFVKE